MKTSTISIIITVCMVALLPPGSHADGSSFITIHTGQERRENLEWVGLTYGLYLEDYAKSASKEDNCLRELINRERVAASLEFSINRIDEEFFTNARYDVSIIPKLRYYPGKSFYVGAGLGFGYNEVEQEDRPDTGLKLGGEVFFAPEFNIGYEFDAGSKNSYIEFIYTHRSNAGLGDNNQSLNFFLIAAGMHL